MRMPGSFGMLVVLNVAAIAALGVAAAWPGEARSAAASGTDAGVMTLAPNDALTMDPAIGIESLEEGAEWRPLDATPASPGRSEGAPGTAGCNIYVRWYTYTAALDRLDSQVRVRGAINWAYMSGDRIGRLPGFVGSPPAGDVVTNGRVWNWRTELKLKGCDLNRRYRFKIVGPAETAEPVRPNPYAGFERWLYFPSSTGWTQQTNIDLGWLDLCLGDGTKCDRPYYPTNQPTPYLKW